MKVKVTARSWTDGEGTKHKQGAEVDVTDRGVYMNALASGRVKAVDEKQGDEPTTGKGK